MAGRTRSPSASHLLYYWRPDNYARDRRFGFGFHLNQNSPAMEAAAPGSSLWAFTRRKRDGLYVFAAELIVKALTKNPPNFRYGRSRLWGDLQRSRYFDIDAGPNAEPLIRALGVQTRGEHLGQSFQGHAAVRAITDHDHEVLAKFARDLPVLQTVAIYPEDEFEARLVHGDVEGLPMMQEGRDHLDARQRYLYETVDRQRARKHVERLQGLYGGRCQVCGYHPVTRYGRLLCHGHHIQWLSRGGEDAPDNLVLVCPSHHVAIHRDDAPFDYGGLHFVFSTGLVEPLVINEHLPVLTLSSRRSDRTTR